MNAAAPTPSPSTPDPSTPDPSTPDPSTPDPSTPDPSSLKPGSRVRVTQQVAQRDEVWTHAIEGEVVKLEQRKTGSWFAHSKDDRLWLDRLTVRRDDGEIVVFNLDAYTHIDAL